MLSGKDIVYFGLDPWDSPLWKDRHEICRRLAASNRVVYVDSRKYFRDLRRDLATRKVSWRQLRGGSLRPVTQGLSIFNYPDWAPISARFPVKQLFRVARKTSLNMTLSRLGMYRPIVWLNTPAMVDLVSEVPSALRIYHAIDQYCAYQDVSPQNRAKILAQERKLVERVDVVIATQQGLCDERRKVNAHTYLVPNGVRYDDYRRARESGRVPASIERVRSPRLGYIGLIGDRLNFRMLRSLAEARPESSLVLMGEVRVTRQVKEWKELAALPNVFHFPPVSIQEVPYFVTNFHVGLIPYRQDEESLYSCPLKLFEYLAAGIPIAAIDIPVVRDFAHYLSIARTPGEFTEAVERALNDRESARAKARAEVGYRNRWSVRLERISEIIETELNRVAENTIASRPRPIKGGRA